MQALKNYLYDLATDKRNSFFSSVVKWLMFLFSLIYGLVVRILILFNLARASGLGVKVISVGNITLGGTGKTSLVEFIAQALKEKGKRVAILTRGYKRRSTVDGRRNTEYDSMGDEPYMLEQKLGDTPVIVDSDRVRGAKKASAEFGADTVILDDGLQQWGIKKDLEIVALSAGNSFGNAQLIPRGILREPLSGLKRADIFVLTKTNLYPQAKDLQEFLRALNPKSLIVETAHEAEGFFALRQPRDSISAQDLKTKPVALFSGIGDPGSFEDLVAKLGIKIGLALRFCDHHAYSQEDLEKIFQGAKARGIDTVITTEKDAARLHSFQLSAFSCQLLILRLKINITKNKDEFLRRLFGIY